MTQQPRLASANPHRPLLQRLSRAGVPAVLLIVVLLLGVLRELQPLRWHLPLDRQLTVDRSGIGAVEIGERGEFRWFARTSSLAWRGMAPVSHDLTLVLHNGAVARTISLGWAGSPPQELALRPGWQTVTLRLAPPPLDWSAAATLVFSMPPLSADAPERAGLAVAALTLTQTTAAYPNPFTLWLLTLAAALLLLSAAAGLSRRAALIGSSAVLIGLTLLHSVGPFAVGAVLDELLIAVLAAAGLIALLRRLTADGWAAAQPYSGRTAFAAALLFSLHAVGMQSPAFINIDHILRAHQVITMAQGRAADVQASLSQQYEWNMQVPYPLLTYWIFTPFYPLLETSAAMTALLKWSGSLFHASTMGLLFGLVLRRGATPREAWYAAALFAGLPLTHLYMHDGSYPTIIGLWATVIGLLVSERLISTPLQTRRWWLWTVLTLALAMLTYVTQAAFVPLLFGVTALAVYRRDDPARRRQSLLLLSALVAGGLAALLLYYGQFVLPVTQTLIERFSSGERPGHDEARLPGPLVGPLWLQIWGHTRVIGLVAAAAGIGLAWRQNNLTVRSSAIGTVVLLAVTLLLDTQFSLWHKHWYFALPLLALFGAHGLAALSSRGRAAGLLAELVIAVLLLESLRAWLLRVIFYDWSLWTI
jgi:hypothetical protein